MSTPLQRRSVVIQVPELPLPFVRVDRVYRLDRQAASASATANTAAPESASALMEAEGGELLWENAMLADHLMVQVEDGISLEQLEGSLPAGVTVRTAITTRGLYLVAVPAEGDRSVERAVLAMSKLKGVVRHAEPDFLICGADTSPNDPLFTTDASDTSKQWHLPKIMAPRAWAVIRSPKTTTIANQTVVAVVDTGVDYTHPDLAANIWNNPGETGSGKETNGIDDDGNGKIDDWRGWNFVELNNEVMDDVGHGTHVAGIIGAVGNNATGASGVCWGVKILPLRIIKAVSGGTFGTYSAAIGAMDYIRTLNNTGRKVAVANHSWGGTGYSLAMLNTINNPLSTADPLPAGITSTYLSDVNTMTVNGGGSEVAKIKVGMTLSGPGIPSGTLVTIVSGSSITLSDHTKTAGTNAALTFSNPVRPKPYGVVHVAAAGNSRFNLDRIPIYPACLPSGFIVSVGATDSSDAEAVWSGGSGTNYGRLNVDLFAPGSSIWSTRWKAPGDPAYGYESRNGTSMAAPQVAGAAALIRMWQPALTELQARQVVIEQVQPVPTLHLKCVSAGRLNVAKVIDRLYQPILVSSGGSSGGTGVSSESLTNSMALVGRMAVVGNPSSSNKSALVVEGGEIYSWGFNSLGELGLGDTRSRSAPVKIPGLSGVVQVVGGMSRACYALDSDGRVWSWGNNSYGELGLGGTDFAAHSTPTQIPGLSDIVWVSAGNTFALAVKADGTVWAWGGNYFGQLGLGDIVDRTSPVQIASLSGVLQVEAGAEHAIALKSDGSVWTWGDQTDGALGNGSSTGFDSTPRVVAGIAGAAFVEAGIRYSAVVTATGSVLNWGYFSEGTPSSSATPVTKAGLSGIFVLSASAYNKLAVDSDGRVWTWGVSDEGGLGLGIDSANVVTPLQVSIPGAPPIIACAVGRDFSLIRTIDGELYAAGTNNDGELGVSRFADKLLPVNLPVLRGAEAVYPATSAGGTYAVMPSGVVRYWGGTGAQSIASTRTVSSLTVINNVRAMFDGASNGAFFVALKRDGSVWSWGYNAQGQLGKGNVTYSSSPSQVAGIQSPVSIAVTPGGFNNDSNMGHVVVAMADGTVKAWGANSRGQVGNGTTSNQASPVTVAGVSGITAVAVGNSHTLALTTTGSVYAWGRNNCGQIGDGTSVNRTSPVLVAAISDVVAIAAVSNQSIALKSDGSVWAWGQNSMTNLGVGLPDGTNQMTPARVQGLPAASEIFAGASAFFAFTQDHKLWNWGVNDIFGRYIAARDPSSVASLTTPAEVVGIYSPVKFAAGRSSASAVTSDGNVWSWGQGSGGAVGDGDAWSPLPVRVTGFGAASTTLSTLGTGETSNSWLLSGFSISELFNKDIVGDSSAPAGDGIPNLIKYALGLNPKQRHDSSSLPAARVDLIGSTAQSAGARGGAGLFSTPTVELQNGKRYMAFTVPRNGGIRQDIDYIVEVSTDLVNWRSGDPHTVTVLDTAETLEVYSAQSLDDVPKQFMRLKIQRK
ncbi:MAG: S8 family serine peptidase [Prosthecobacter sp.]|uniref:RCC1 domain-containing protein n=1 Tax=Prosthecobacter sp. TaxID=1965333 RepID=UPI0019ED48AC|nr:S8 family serine peptidase [Prosthecobacter sp.]MBE2284091.1 S8 family serine peptidase [Prosthecobacter sp.]